MLFSAMCVHTQSLDEQSLTDTSSSADSSTRVLTQQSIEPMSLSSVEEVGRDPSPDSSKDSGITELSTSEETANALPQNMINKTKVCTI